MATYGDEKDCGGYIRRYYDSKWDLIISDDDEYFYRDKLNHITYECKDDLSDKILTNQLGNVIDKYDDDDEDEIWDDVEDDVEDEASSDDDEETYDSDESEEEL